MVEHIIRDVCGIKNYQKQLTLLILSTLFLFGLFLRYKNIQPYNLVFDFDQYEDLFYTYRIVVDHDPVIIGRAIYGDARLHHGVFYYYYNLIPFALSYGNPFASAYWNSFFNASTLFIIFILARSLFNKVLPAILAASIVVVSFEFIKFSNWLTIDTAAIFTVPLFYLGLVLYLKNLKFGAILAVGFLGLSIQTDLTFLYLIPVLILFWLIFKPKVPSLRLALTTFLTFILSILTLILTEIKLNFSGVKTLLNFSNTFDATKLSLVERINFFIQDFGKQFSYNLFPQRTDLGIFLAIIIILIAISPLSTMKTPPKERQGIYLLLLYLFSPLITLLVGYHQKPWFLIGLPPAIALISGYAISRLKSLVLILPVVFLIIWSNTVVILQRPQKAYQLFNDIYDSTSYLDYQIQALEYTYQQSKGQPFAINAVTYPLYYNGMWAYLYHWYGKGHFGYVPSWLGGDQLHPYDLLPKSKGEEKIFFMIISNTPRIPQIYQNLGKTWALQNGQLLEEKIFNDFTILKLQKNEKS